MTTEQARHNLWVHAPYTLLTTTLPPGDVADDTGPPSTDTVCAYLALLSKSAEREREKHVRVCAAVGGAGGTLVCVPCFESVLCERVRPSPCVLYDTNAVCMPRAVCLHVAAVTGK